VKFHQLHCLRALPKCAPDIPELRQVLIGRSSPQRLCRRLEIKTDWPLAPAFIG